MSWSRSSAIPQTPPNLEEALDDPIPLEMVGVKEQEQKEKDSTFVQDMGLKEEQEMDIDSSFQDPDYWELEESFVSGKGRGVKFIVRGI